MVNCLAGVTDVLDTWWGLTLFIVLDVVILLFVIALNYKWLFKRLLDILFSALFLLLFSPLFVIAVIAQAVYNARANAYPALFQHETVCGKKRRPVQYAVFACERVLHDAEGNRLPEEKCITPMGRVLRACGMKYYPALVAVLAGRLSFVGPRPMSLTDAVAVTGESEARFDVRPGLVSSLERYGGEKLTYPDMLEEDVEYAAHRGLFRDVSFFVTKIAHRLRGDRIERIYGVCAFRSYVDWLQETGAMTAELATDCALQADGILAEQRRRKRERDDFMSGHYTPFR